MIFPIRYLPVESECCLQGDDLLLLSNSQDVPQVDAGRYRYWRPILTGILTIKTEMISGTHHDMTWPLLLGHKYRCNQLRFSDDKLCLRQHWSNIEYLNRIAAFCCAHRPQILIPEIEYYQKVSSHAQIWPQGAEELLRKVRVGGGCTCTVWKPILLWLIFSFSFSW